MYVVCNYTDILVQDFVEPETHDVGNEPLKNRQAMHKDRTNLLAF